MTEKTQIVQDACRRLRALPNRTIAQYILFHHGAIFDGNLEKIRDSVRYYFGVKGNSDKEKAGKAGSLITRLSSPVMPETWRKTRTAYKLPLGLWLVINDIHIPFHEPKPLETALKYGKDKKIDGILINGDLQDYASISFWMSSVKRDFDKEISMVLDFLDLLKKEFPKQKKVWKPGNHEYRFPRLYQAKFPDLMGLPMIAMDAVLDLEGRGIEFLDYRQIVDAGILPILHGHEIATLSRAINPARGLFLRTKSWAMCGHCHTTSEHTERNIQGTILTTWSVGCLCDLSPDYNPYGNNWNWGFALVNVEKNGNFRVENKRILPSGKVV
jgi:hypothetical protein